MFRPGDYIGLSFRDHGRDRAGVDCYGLVVLVLREQCGIEVHEPAYIHAHDLRTVEQAIIFERPRWRRVVIPECFDAVVFYMGGRPLHVGLMIDGQRMLHILDNGAGSVIASIRSFEWFPRVEGFYRYGA